MDLITPEKMRSFRHVNKGTPQFSLLRNSLTFLESARALFNLKPGAKTYLLIGKSNGQLYVCVTAISEGAWPITGKLNKKIEVTSTPLADYIRKFFNMEGDLKIQIGPKTETIDGRKMYELTAKQTKP